MFQKRVVAPTRLNEPSREFIRRLSYLIRERHILEPRVLEAIIASPTPLNPFIGMKVNVSTLPHLAAFTELLKENLQWEAIQQTARGLLGESKQVQKREDNAQNLTKVVPIPVEVRDYHREIHQVFRTSKDQTLAVSIANSGSQGKESATIFVLDALTGTELSAIPVAGNLLTTTVKLTEFNDMILALVQNTTTGELMTVDLLAKTVLAHKVVGPSPAEVRQNRALRPIARFVTLGGKLLILAVNGPMIRAADGPQGSLLDAFTGKDVDQIALNNEPFFVPGVVNVFGAKIAVADTSRTQWVDLSHQQPVNEDSSNYFYDQFSFRGQTYALALDRIKGYSQNQIWLKTRNVDTGIDSPSFALPFELQEPLLVGTFEKDQTLIGLLATEDDDLYQVDLITGQVLTRLFDTALQNHGVRFRAGDFNFGRLLFTFKGKPYVVAVMNGNENEGPQVFVMDALTFERVNQGLALGNRNVLNLQLLPLGKDGLPRVVVTYHDHRSSVVTIVRLMLGRLLDIERPV